MTDIQAVFHRWSVVVLASTALLASFEVEAARGGAHGGHAGGARAAAHTSVHRAAAGGGARASRPAAANRAPGGGAGARDFDRTRDVDRNINRNINRDVNRNVNRNINRDIDIDVDIDDHDHWNDWDDHPFATAAAVTAGVAITSAVIGSIVYSVPPTCVTTVVNGIAYQQCGSTWYRPQYYGTNVQYVVVASPY